ncbi:MAG: alpha/beta hydrolase [Alphaproteobacteria bacterium]|nr:alpha/beta hydrolase [Alphaproteobacteria bacterium]
MVLAACMPLTQKTGLHNVRPAIEAGYYVTADGVRLPLGVHSANPSRAVIVALHGFNDYRTEFDMAAEWWMLHGITTYAYDQRGFGGAPRRGVWPGAGVLADDARSMILLARAAHPDVPVYLLGMSMGGAVALELAGSSIPPDVDGVILAAPAVWGWSSLNPLYKGVLWVAAHTVRANKMTGQGLGIVASDNLEMLRALGRDPLIIHETRTDAVYGLVEQMERGYRAGSKIQLPVLVLYGEKDRVIPKRPVRELIAALPGPKRVIIYPNGYHMLLRDLQAETVWRDIAGFVKCPPSRGQAPGE